jgi:hypothetical protein
MTDETHKILKTPSYLRKAIDNYATRNPELIKERQRQYYQSLTPEQKQLRYLKIKETRLLKTQNTNESVNNNDNSTDKTSSKTPTQEQRDAYKAKQRANYQKRKLLKKVELDIPIDKLTIE